MIHLDLFSGIGGFALAASRVWQNHNVVGFCEIDPFCQKVLKKHWPDAPICDDIKKLKGSDFGTVELISGGFPCQPFSAAGQRKGTEDDRYLWPEMLRVISEIHPRWIVAENVAGLVSLQKGMVLDTVLSDLESEGYQVQPFIIPACAVGAPHRRDRIWIVGYSGSRRFKASDKMQTGKKTGNGVPEKTDRDATNTGRKHGESGRSKKHGPDQAERTPQASQVERCGEVLCNAPNTSNQRLQRGQWQESHDQRPAPHGSVAERDNPWHEPWIEVATRLCRVDDGLPRRMDRTARLKALGNAIVPQVAEQIFRAIKECNKCSENTNTN